MRLSLLPLIALALLAAGCATGRPAGGAAGLVGPTWHLAALGGDRPAGPEATLTFSDDGRVSGTTGCNRVTGTYDLGAGGALSLSPLGTTRMACPPPAVEQERRVLDALARVDRAQVEGGRLVLLDAGATPLAAFTTSDTPLGGAEAQAGAVTGTVTYLPRIALPPDAVVTVRLLGVSRADAPSETLAEQTIAAEGRQVPFPFTLRYDEGEVDPQRRYVVRAEIRDGSGGLIWTTDMAYPVLGSAPSSGVEVRLVQVDGLGGGAGALIGPEWRLAQIRTSTGGAVAPEGDGGFTVSFLADGRFTGQADCNRYGGTFQAEPGGDLVLSDAATTLAACAPPSSSREFFGVLGQVVGYSVAGDQLTLRGADGGALVFERGGQGGGPPQETGRDYAYTCDSPDGPFTFRIRTGPGEIALWLPERFGGREGGTHPVLGQVHSASGVRYQDGPVTVWTEGVDEALLEVDGETFQGCKRALR